MSTSKSNRRDFLELLGISSAGIVTATCPLLKFYGLVLGGAASRALAQSNGITAKKWVDFRLDGAPSRWVFDLLLNPYHPISSMKLNPHLGTRYVKSGNVYDSVEYHSEKLPAVIDGVAVPANLRNIFLPPLWQHRLHNPNGPEKRFVWQLLENFLNVRGIDVNSESHPAAQINHFMAVGATKSVSALSSDYSSAPLAHVFSNIPQFRFKSKNSKTAMLLVGKTYAEASTNRINYIRELLEPFSGNFSANFRSGKVSYDTFLENSQQILKASAESNHPEAAVINGAFQDAKSMFERTFPDLTTTWTALLNKYRSIIRNSVFDVSLNSPFMQLPGVYDDFPVGIAGTRDKTYDLENRIVSAGSLPDLRNLMEATSGVQALAESFALSEFVLLNDISDSLSLGIGAITTKLGGIGFDEHNAGNMISLMSNTYHCRAYAGCLFELIYQLTQAGMFDNTVINCSGEFNRSPKVSGFGSDHGIKAASLAMFCGKIKGPYVLGNILKDAPEPSRYGTWGYQAPTDGKLLNTGHSAATIATCLGVPNPSTTSTSLVMEDPATKEIKPAIADRLGRII